MIESYNVLLLEFDFVKVEVGRVRSDIDMKDN